MSIGVKKGEVLMFEIYDRKQSNVYITGTDSNPVYLDGTSMHWIPNEGYRIGKDGNLEKIRYLENDMSIVVADQDARKVPVDKSENKIFFEKSVFSIPVDESTSNLAEYLSTVLYNKSAPRPANSRATILFDVVRLDEKAEQEFEGEDVYAEALALLYSLRKRDNGKYVYNEEKIKAYCNILGEYGGDSIAEKFRALNIRMKGNPEEFIELVTGLDNTVKTELAEAIKLKVISLSDGVASFDDGEKIIIPLPSELKTASEKIEFVSDFLKTNEGNQFLTEMRIKIDVKRNKKLANK